MDTHWTPEDHLPFPWSRGRTGLELAQSSLERTALSAQSEFQFGRTEDDLEKEDAGEWSPQPLAHCPLVPPALVTSASTHHAQTHQAISLTAAKSSSHFSVSILFDPSRALNTANCPSF